MKEKVFAIIAIAILAVATVGTVILTNSDSEKAAYTLKESRFGVL